MLFLYMTARLYPKTLHRSHCAKPTLAPVLPPVLPSVCTLSKLAIIGMRYCVASVVPTDQPCRPSSGSAHRTRNLPTEHVQTGLLPTFQSRLGCRFLPCCSLQVSTFQISEWCRQAGYRPSPKDPLWCATSCSENFRQAQKQEKSKLPQSKCQNPMPCYAYPHHASCMYTRASIRWQPKRSKRGGTVPLYAYAWEVGVLPKVMIVRGCSGCWSLTFDERAVVSGKSNPPTPGTGPSSIQSVGGVLYDSFDKRLSPFPSNLLADCVNQVHCPKVKYLRLRAGNGAVQGRH